MYLRNVGFLIVFLFSVHGCGQDAPSIDKPTALLGIGLRLAPEVPTQFNVTLIEIAISTPDMAEPEVTLIREEDIDQGARAASIQLSVPVASSVTFSVRAFEGDCPVFGGILENENIDSARTAPINITLDVIDIVVGVRAEQDILSVGDRYELEVYVEDAPGLVSLTCELEFDEKLLEPLEAVPGDFFGSDVLFIEDSEFLRREENRLAIGITLKGDAPGVCGSGVAFRVVFRAVSSGQTAVTLLENVTLTTAGFEQIEDASRIRIESNAFVEIQ